MNILDFICGGLLMNAMPHFIFGIADIRFLGMFGFSPKGNILYALAQFALCLVLFHLSNGIQTILDHGIFLGAAAVLFFFLIFGKPVMRYYQKKKH